MILNSDHLNDVREKYNVLRVLVMRMSNHQSILSLIYLGHTYVRVHMGLIK